MEIHDFEFNEFGIPIAVGLAFQRFDFIVCDFQGTGGDGIKIIVQESLPMSLQS